MSIGPRESHRRGAASEKDLPEPGLQIDSGPRHAGVAPHSPHPWWSRVLYALYGVFLCVASVFAYRAGQTSAAIAGAGIALFLFWKAAQRVR